MNLEIEQETVLKVEELVRARDLGQICFEVGKFIELVASEIFLRTNKSKPKSAKAAIDFLVENRFVSRLFGYKLQTVRELRNTQAHGLQYSITEVDAEIAIDVLNCTIEWLHQGHLAREWREIQNLFDAEAWIHSETDAFVLIMKTHQAMEAALHLKIRSLNLEAERRNFFSSVELLLKHGIDVRSDAWRILVAMRNTIAHSKKSDQPTAKEFQLLRTLLPELQNILMKLNPLEHENTEGGDYPQVRVML